MKNMSFVAVAALICFPVAASAEEPVRLKEAFPAGYQYHVSARVDLSGKVTLPPEKGKTEGTSLNIVGNSAIEYDERVLGVAADGQVEKTLRIFRQIDFQRKVGDRADQNTIRPAVRRMVLVRQKNVEVPFSPDGPLTWNEIDLVRTDVFTPALTGLLPDDEVRIGDRWTAKNLAIQELTDMERLEEGKIECKLDQFMTLERRRHARITFSGSVRGIDEDGPNRQQLDGYCLFDMESNHLSYLSLNGVKSLLDKDGKVLGTVKGQFVLSRQANQRSRDLSDDAIKGVVLEPNADNTLLLFDNADLGIRLLYPRRWRIAGARGQQLGIDETNGSGLLLTIEPASKAITGAQFQKEASEWLRQQQKAKILRTDPPRQLRGAPNELEQFALDAEIDGQRVLLDYYILRQKEGGVTIAARLLPKDLPALRADLERIAKSVTITREIGEGKK